MGEGDGATVALCKRNTRWRRNHRAKGGDVLEGDTPEALQQRVMREAEWVILSPGC